MNKIKIYTILICGIPGIGKSYFCQKFMDYLKGDEKNNNFVYLSFDAIEQISEDNFSKYQEMRDDYNNNYKQNIIKYINNPNSAPNFFLLLDDNFYLKSMRKKIYQSLTIIIESYINSFEFYYSEIFLKANDIGFALKMNEQRKNKIPEEIIQKMNSSFEYSSPYLENNNNIKIKDIIDLNSINSFNFQEFVETHLNKKCKLELKKKEMEQEQLTKNQRAQLIDDIEISLRQSIGEILRNKKYSMNGKIISEKKKEYMKKISSLINNNLTNDLFTKEEDKNIIFQILSQNQNTEKIKKYITDYFFSSYLN